MLSQGASLGPQLEAIFDSYWQTQPADDREPDLWEMDATLAWFSDLDVTPEEPVMLAVAHLCGAKDMGKFEKKAWVDGWKTARQDSVDKQRNHIQQLASQLKTDPAYFRKIYSYTFDYARGAENANVRVLPLETAAAHWDLLLPHTPDIMFQPDSLYNHNKDPTRAQQALDKWKDWLASPTGGNSKAISKDVWNQVSLLPSKPSTPGSDVFEMTVPRLYTRHGSNIL